MPQHDEQKCKKCSGFVVGQDAIAAMSNGLCSHCGQKGKLRKPKTTEQKKMEASHRAGKLADRAQKNREKAMPGHKRK